MTDNIGDLTEDDIKKERLREQKRNWANKNKDKLALYKYEWAKKNPEKHAANCRPHAAAYYQRKRDEKLFVQELQNFLYMEYDVELDIDPLF